MLERNVATGIHRVEDAHTNWYLVEDGDRLTVVDAGAGDAVVTFNPYTARTGPQLVARAANADTERALASLDALAALAALDAETVLTGHGEPWRNGTDAIVQRARAAGVQ